MPVCRAEDERRCDCGALEAALAALPGARRMVVGHTIQDAGINSACGGRVLRIDVGLSAGCGDNLLEGCGIQTGSANQGAINLFLRQQFFRVLRLHAAAVENADGVGDAGSQQF